MNVLKDLVCSYILHLELPHQVFSQDKRILFFKSLQNKGFSLKALLLVNL
jgi:hypothetical protein